MKKLLPLLILVILGVSLPSVIADNESLYVDSYTGDLANWDERNAPSPYLADESTGFVHEVKSSAATEGYFGFADPIGSGTINSVTLYIECYGDDTNDLIWIFVDCSDGGGWVNEGTIYVNQLSYDWETLSLTTRLDSWPDIQNAQIYLYYQGVGGGDDIFVRRAYLYVDYTPGGAEYTRGASQSLSWSGVSYRTWGSTRSFSQPLTVSSDSSRTWSLSRTLSQGISLASNTFFTHLEYFLRTLTIGLTIASDSLRTGTLSRSFEQDISFASTTEKLTQLIRNPVQGITASVEALRSWTLKRTFSLPITFSSNALAEIFKNFKRTLTIALKLSSSSLRKWSLSRGLFQSITVSSLAERGWSLVRVVSQSLTTTLEANRIVSAIRQASQNIALSSNAWRFMDFIRGLSQSLTLASDSLRRWDIKRTFDQGLSFISSIFTDFTEYFPSAEEFFRSVSLGMEIASSNIRQWNMKRGFSQGIIFVCKRGPQLIQRTVTMSITMLKDAVGSIEKIISSSYGIIPSQTTPTENPPAFTINNNFLSLGITLVIGSVVSVLYWRNYKAKDISDVKKFKDRRDQKPGVEKDVPEELKKRRK